ncbi:hypothetical protein Cgig2_028032 [Carnegiea gigantea]|uniref:Uncharacterized protein n=1 Tax=Carnegiea gigantea TaxID=171969 RepID=A0A9Q1GZ81_9CARY|nr:hypothetical protein Cgig2_028032 [Carnegiea gigantea]
MAALMASRQRISLTPTTLDYIYHGLGEAASHLDHLGKANTIFPIYNIVGWLAELFPSLYSNRPNSDCPGDFPSLVYYAGLLGKEIFGIVETVVKIENSVDVDQVKALSNQDITCSSEIVHIEDQLNNLSSKASKHKVKEQELLREEEWVRQMQEDLTAQQQVLLEAEGKLKSSPDSKKEEAE